MMEQNRGWEAAYGCVLLDAIEWSESRDCGHALTFENPAGERVSIVVWAGPCGSYDVYAVEAIPGELPIIHEKRVAALVPSWPSDCAPETT